MNHYLQSIFRFLASVQLAVILLVGFVVLLSFATFYESYTSTEAAQRLIYQSAWFDFLLFFLGVNVFCSAISRLPWKKRHIGFVITHLGIIIILLGSMITRQFGVEGQLVLQEGKKADSIVINESTLVVSLPRLNVRNEIDPWFMNKGIPSGKEVRYEIGDTGIACFIDQYLVNPRSLERIENSNPQPNPAVLIALHQSGQTEIASQEWLFANSPHRNRLDLGMASLEFKRVETPEQLQTALAQPIDTPAGPEGSILLKTADGQTAADVAIQDILATPFAFEWNEKPYTLQFNEFFTRAAVENSALVERETGAINPAVRLTLTGPDGNPEKHLAFALYPDLGSFHGEEKKPDRLTAQFVYPTEKFSSGGNHATIVLDGEGTLHYRATNTSGQWLRGEITLETPFQSTWPSVDISVQKFYKNATLTEDIIDAGADAPGPRNNPLLHVRVESNGQSADRYVAYNRPSPVTVGTETVMIEFGQKKYPMGFTLQLIDFQAPRYPGTNRPARYQSLVKLIDPTQQIEEEQLVYMNNPLAYNRFLVYQSGYEEGINGAPDTSIFTVARAPGTSTIYLGSLVLCLGMVYMFITRRTTAIPTSNEA